MKKIVVCLITIILLMGVFAVPSSAASSVIALSAKEVKVGGNIVVTVTVNAGEEMYSAGFSLSYNQDVLKFKSGSDANGGAGVVTVASGVSGEKKKSYVLNFSALKAGSSSLSVADCAYVGISGSEKAIGGAAATVTVKDVTKSNNANLYSLRPAAGQLSPAFSSNVTSYTVTVPYDVTECKVYTRTQDAAASVRVEGSATMKVGKNTRTVIVTAPDGTEKSYTIVITREEQTQEEKPEEKPEDEITVTIENGKYKMLSDLSDVTVPEGFLIADAEYENKKISVAEDENGRYMIYFLKDTAENGKTGMFFLNEQTESFEALPYLKIGKKFYILEHVDDSKGAPEGTRFEVAKIGDFHINAFVPKNEKMEGFYYLNCYINGQNAYYRYDSEMKVMQRELGLVFADEVISDEIQANPELANKNIIERFLTLSAIAKIVVIAVILIVVIIIVLIVLVIVQAVAARREALEVPPEAMVEGSGFLFDPENIPAEAIPVSQEPQPENEQPENEQPENEQPEQTEEAQSEEREEADTDEQDSF